MEGVIKNMVRDRGFGFIKSTAGNDYFFHCSNVEQPDKFDEFEKGDEVEFEDCEGKNGLYAEQIRRR